MLARRLLKRLLGHTEFYHFCSWLSGEYYSSRRTQYRPDQFKYFGEGAHVANGVKINMPGRVILKDYANIGKGTMINSSGGLYVGRYSGISYDCVIWTGEHRYRGSKAIPFDQCLDLKPVVIHDFVWIGTNVKIPPGKNIGEGAIVGMGSVIGKDVPPLAIMFGNPAEIIGYRDKNHFEKCKTEGLVCSSLIDGDKYEERIIPLYKRKFKSEMFELGLLDL